MTSKEALENLGRINLGDNPYCIFEDNLLKNCCKEEYEKIEKDLERLEMLEKAIEIILKYKIRPSTFVFTIKNYREMYGKDLTLEKAYILLDFCGTQEEYELLKEVLENDK